jgi:5-methylcytosine-specific restriction endonuclease McrA
LERLRRQANPEKVAAARQRYRAAKKVAGGGVSEDEWLTILTEFDHRCAYCNVGGSLEMEHMTPLSRGGLHTTDNVVPACPTCNRRKGPLTALEFLARI